MELSKIQKVFFILLLMMRTCSANFFNEILAKEDHLDLGEVTAKILNSCYKTRVNTIGLAGTFPASLIALLSSDASFSVTLLDDTERSVDLGPVSRDSWYKLQLFVVTASSSTELERILREIKNSKWWNHMAPFYIFEWPEKKHGCSGSYEFLMMAWRMNLLEAKFICIDGKKGPLIYTFNPYTSHAPVPWQLVTTHTGENNHSWALLMREYRDDSEICDNIDFEKDIDLGGYEIRLNVPIGMWNIEVFENKTGIDALSGLSGSIWQSIFRKLNGTGKLMIQTISPTNLIGFYDDKGIYRGILGETNSGISDLALIEIFRMLISNLTTTYPHYASGVVALTQYRGHASQLSKIINVLDIELRICLGIVLLITIIFLRYFVGQAAGITILNIIRMICNGSLTNLPNDSASRFYLAGLLFLVVTIQGIYQGQMSAIVTGKTPLKLVNTLADLEQSDYTIHAHYVYFRYMDQQVFNGRSVSSKSWNCTNDVLQNSSIACLTVLYWGLKNAAITKLHPSKEVFAKDHTVWLIRPDWPLERRINVILQRLVEAHMFQYTYEKYLLDESHIVDKYNDEYEDKSFKVVTLEQLGFAFVLLGIGLGCATICFVVEILVARHHRNSKIRRRFKISRRK